MGVGREGERQPPPLQAELPSSLLSDSTWEEPGMQGAMLLDL